MDRQGEYLKKMILTASCAQINTLLLAKAIHHLKKAKIAMVAGDIEERSKCTMKVADIITFLACDLENYSSAEFTEIVGKFYLAVIQVIPKVDFSNDPKVADHVIEVLNKQREAWKSIWDKEIEQGLCAETATEVEMEILPQAHPKTSLNI